MTEHDVAGPQLDATVPADREQRQPAESLQRDIDVQKRLHDVALVGQPEMRMIAVDIGGFRAGRVEHRRRQQRHGQRHGLVTAHCRAVEVDRKSRVQQCRIELAVGDAQVGMAVGIRNRTPAQRGARELAIRR